MPLDLANCRVAIPRTQEQLTAPDLPWRLDATQVQATRENHDSLLERSSVFRHSRLVQPTIQREPVSTLLVVSWNLERCKNVEGTAAVLARHGADICLLTEMDYGMARSSNRDTTADLAGMLEMGHAFGVEFIELGLGDAREQDQHAGQVNDLGLHGNAIASTLQFEQVAILPLDAGGAWFNDDGGNDQRRIGGRMGIAAQLRLPQPIWFIAVHYESRLGPNDRAEETRNLLKHIHTLCGNAPVLIGGDFNCKTISENGLTGHAALEAPAEAEPMFALLAEAGFDWRSCNTTETTTRNHPWSVEKSRTHKIDWFFSRGLDCRAPAVIPAVDENGMNLSDHEAIAVEIVL